MPERQDTLPEQMRALLPDDSSVVSADEAMAIASIRAGNKTRRGHLVPGRVPWIRMNPAFSRRPAWVWLSVIAVLAVVLVFGFKALPSSKSSRAPASNPGVPASSTATTIERHVVSPTKRQSATWPMRMIVRTGTAQDIAPTADGVYWLTNDHNVDPSSSSVTPFRYVPATGRVIRGPPITGTVGSPAITDTGGWVWMVVGVGGEVVVEQLDTSTLALKSRQYLPVKDNMFAPDVDPVLTATIEGPLWVAGAEDLWALNPSTGAIEAEFDTGNQIESMSTDPTGSLLYSGGWTTAAGDMTVTEYDARTGGQLGRSHQEAASPGTVAATDGGVWVTLRTGNYGRAFELSSTDLSETAPPPIVSTSLGIYDQIGGVGASISEGTLWLTSSAEGGSWSLTCANPTNGAVRATEPVQVEDPIASGPLLYAFYNDYLVTMTPPAKCFG
ncbi:MAG: hypothetical protein ACLP6E_15900 [Acidimicrobiales bacterium]